MAKGIFFHCQQFKFSKISLNLKTVLENTDNQSNFTSFIHIPALNRTEATTNQAKQQQIKMEKERKIISKTMTIRGQLKKTEKR